MKAFFSFRKTLLALLFISLAAGLFAFPGITSLCPTESGQYVYYRDYTFPEETYLGFLQYDEGTYAIRYFTPEPKNGALPIIELYFTLNTDVDYVEFTGEKIASPVSEKDIETMNYMHDMVYEFQSRRKKLNDADFLQTVTSTEEFMQFGGSVTITWDFYIPLFNLHTISSAEGDILLEAVTTGTLKNNNDRSFSSFVGVTNIPILDDYYLSSIAGTGENQPLFQISDAVYLVGTTETPGVLTKMYTPFTENPLSDEDRAFIDTYLEENAWQVFYPEIYQYFSLIDNLFLPYTTLSVHKTSFYLRAFSSEDGSDLSASAYMIIGSKKKGFGFEKITLIIPIDDYWSNAEYYDSLVQ